VTRFLPTRVKKGILDRAEINLSKPQHENPVRGSPREFAECDAVLHAG
jgi:hypothetical protein